MTAPTTPLAPNVQPAAGYAGDISAEQAWAWVQSGEAELVDVRTDAERAWVGFVPGAHALAWKQWPGMAMNPGFDAGVQALGAGGKKLVLLCRSGQRTIDAGLALEAAGFTDVAHVVHGFEGDLDARFQRSSVNGWRHEGLPWEQM